MITNFEHGFRECTLTSPKKKVEVQFVKLDVTFIHTIGIPCIYHNHQSTPTLKIDSCGMDACSYWVILGGRPGKLRAILHLPHALISPKMARNS